MTTLETILLVAGGVALLWVVAFVAIVAIYVLWLKEGNRK